MIRSQYNIGTKITKLYHVITAGRQFENFFPEWKLQPRKIMTSVWMNINYLIINNGVVGMAIRKI